MDGLQEQISALVLTSHELDNDFLRDKKGLKKSYGNALYHSKLNAQFYCSTRLLSIAYYDCDLGSTEEHHERVEKIHEQPILVKS